MVLYFSSFLKKLVVPFIIIVLVCAACAPAVTEPETILPEVSAVVPEQQHSTAPDGIGESAADTNIEIGSPVEPPMSGESSGQSDHYLATQEETGETTTNQNSFPSADNNSAVAAPPAENSNTTIVPSAENSGAATAPPAKDDHAATAPPAGNNNSATAPPVGDSSSATAPPAENSGAATAPPAENSGAATAPPAENSIASAASQIDELVVLTISGNGVNGVTTWTLDQLQALREGYRELTYSTTNNWPSFERMEAHGISIPYLLRQAGLRSNAASIKFVSTDGYFATLTFNQVFGTRYSYASHSAAGSSGASAVEPVVAWAWGNVGKTRQESIRPFFGQSGPWEVNTASFVKDLCKIEVSTTPAGTWAVPGASIADGSTVSAGAELELTHSNMDNIRIYYTLDGSEPGYSSPVYNQSASYFQPQLIKPLILTKSVTVKAFAAGIGKERSPAVAFSITVV